MSNKVHKDVDCRSLHAGGRYLSPLYFHDPKALLFVVCRAQREKKTRLDRETNGEGAMHQYLDFI